ncbi:MAG TPA: hypothetical protein VGB45_10095 [Abditibacterium sp.]|jgi:hypothetical protein
MNYKFWGIILAASTFGTSQNAFAQREPASRQERRQQRQQEMANLTPEQRAEAFRTRWEERYKSATPEQKARMDEQRAQMNARLKEQGLDPNNPADIAKAMQNGGFGGRGGNRGNQNGAQAPANRDAARRALMNSAGISEKATQDAIIAFMNSEETARQPVLRLARAAAASLSSQNQTQNVALEGDNSSVTRAFEAYENALVADKTRHQNALVALDEQISYSQNPRLKTFLSLVGVLDSDALALGGAAAIFTPATPAVVPTAE